MSATATTMKKFEATENSAATVQASQTYSFNVLMFEFHGNAWVSWHTSYPGRVRLAVAIFNGPVPSGNNPVWMNAAEVTGQVGGSWDSGQRWGSGYSAGLLGVTQDNNYWISIGVNTPVTSG
jgi:hypothetical protein